MREILGMKQDALAIELGSDWSQKKVSLLEAKDMIERPLLEQVAKALKVPVEAIENFDDTSTVLNIQNNYEGSVTGNATANNGFTYENCTINPVEKWLDALEENKKLYEQLLQSEREKVTMLQQLLDKK